MLYNEFIEGTGCKDNEHNYKVYKELEIIYMNTDCTKEHIYEMGKKLVDNSKSEAELKFEAKIKAEIEQHKKEIARYMSLIEHDKHYIEYWKAAVDKDMYNMYRNLLKFNRDQVRFHKSAIAKLKLCLA
ncbi:MAG: hypothetical protein K5637_01790 [Lachnospiraceae bacterium]|nr:hypothetical protein [Lachnospiraceae bacterium]